MQDSNRTFVTRAVNASKFAGASRRQRGMTQRGMTLIGWMIMLVIIAFAALIVLKVFPMYFDSFKISAALESVIKDAGVVDMSKKDIKIALEKRFDIDNVHRFRGMAFKEYAKIDKKGQSVTITFDYKLQEHVLGNVSVIAHFVKTVHN
ncbi:MAG: DUF4845 domain-containing protein [Gammaproteobacteria bacterium]